MSYQDEGGEYYDGEYEPQYEEGFLEEGAPEGEYYDEGQEYMDGQEINVNIPAEEDYPSFDDIGLTDDAIRIVQDFVLANGHLRLTAEDLADAMRDIDGNEHPDSIEFARMVLDVWRMRNPDLETIDEEYPRDQPPEPVHQQDGPIMEDYEYDQYGQPMQQPPDDAYDQYQAHPGEQYDYYEPQQNDMYESPVEEMYEQPMEMSEPPPEMTYDPPSEVYEASGEQIYEPAMEEIYEPADEEMFEPADEEMFEPPVEEMYEPPAEETYEPPAEQEYHFPAEPSQSVQESYTPPAMESREASHSGTYGQPKAQPAPSEPQVIYEETEGQYVIYPPRPEHFPVFDEAVDFAARIVENFLILNGHLKLPPEELAQSLVHPDGTPFDDAFELAEMVLSVWSQRNPTFEGAAQHMASLPAHLIPPGSAPVPTQASAPAAPQACVPAPVQPSALQSPEQIITKEEVLITIPLDEEYPPCSHPGMNLNAARVVRSFVLQNSSLAISPIEVARDMTEYGGDRWAVTAEVAEQVLEVWRKKNPHLPTEKPAPKVNIQAEVIEHDEPKDLTTIQLASGATLVIPPETDYSSFDRSGLTDDAIRIVREFVTETGSLGITEELIAAQMVDFMGNRSSDALPIAKMVLDVWRKRNETLPLTSVKEIYPGVIQEEPAPPAAPPALARATSASAEITNETSKNAVIPETAEVTSPPQEAKKPPAEPPAPAGPILYGEAPNQFVHVERDDSRDFVYAPELKVLMEMYGCGVEPFHSATFGPGVRFTTVSSKSLLYNSGVEPGDHIVAINGQQIFKLSQLYTVLSRMTVGSHFTWRLRRVSVLGNCSEWSIIQRVPAKKKKAIEPRFAGIPPAEQYRSHSGLLPADPGFRERYAQVPSYLVQVPQHRPTKKYWDTRVVQRDTVVASPVQRSPAAITAPASPPKAIAAPASPPKAIAAPPSVSLTEGTRIVYPLEGKPYRMPLSAPLTTSGPVVPTSIVQKQSPSRSASPTRSVTSERRTTERSRVVYPATGAPYAVPLGGPASPATIPAGSPKRSVTREVLPPKVISATPKSASVQRGSPLAPSRTEIVLPSEAQIAAVRGRMLQKYQASMKRSIHVTEERIPLSQFMRPEIIGTPQRCCSPAQPPVICAPVRASVTRTVAATPAPVSSCCDAEPSFVICSGGAMVC